ncbi:cysteine hydrolase [Metamycoplasma phocicerebrale]|uniref:Cysteine hydrolase n=1 Tax=Metamycoplasma phocicerebrale TaxID=142649 RepID=A0A3T0TTL4_9BACT|nr:isochorismatase family cysteine hydrolase [Metamycoplasma phocicerebrale]AZZ65316.1 cysteine hydrolase [Metamycoplasma phocicerebrale]
MKKIIFVIDMVKGFCIKGNLASSDINKIVPNIKNYLEKNKENKIVFINDNHSKNDIEMEVYPLHCLSGTEESEVVEELKPYAKTIIKKNTTNSFFAIENKSIFEEFDTFEIIGCCTDICILQFALTLKTYLNFKNINKDVVVFKNLVDTFNSKDHNRIEYHNNALNLMNNAGIKIK